MNLIHRMARGCPTSAAAFLISGFASTAALATPAAEAQALMRQELTVCASGASTQSREACVREARAAYAQNRRGALDDRDANYLSNASKRCEALEGSDRAACVSRMQGRGTTSGSASTGGIYRELVVPGDAASTSGKSSN